MIELSHKPLIRAYQMDCMEFMADKPDGCYPLAIVDPPYGIGVTDNKAGMGRRHGDLKATYKIGDWDKVIPGQAYFKELFRASCNQVIWGANNFKMPPTKSFVVWDKTFSNEVSFSSCEYAWVSNGGMSKLFKCHPNAFLKESRIHITQKPVSLYRWLLTNYAKPGQTILDTHGGSFSSAIACWHEGYDMDICEIDEEYFEAACERFERETRQQKLFSMSGER